MPEALISSTTSPGPGVGSGNSASSSLRLPSNVTPRIAPLLFVSAVASSGCRRLSRLVDRRVDDVRDRPRAAGKHDTVEFDKAMALALVIGADSGGDGQLLADRDRREVLHLAADV